MDTEILLILKYISYAVTIASGARLALHWLRGLLEISIPSRSKFWSVYDKTELSLAYISVSLAAFGRKAPVSTLEAPVTKAESSAEGRIVK